MGSCAEGGLRMKLVLAILSDIHFTNDYNNPIPQRVDPICAAIASAEVLPDAIVLLFSGDIANKGQQSEYIVAAQFIRDLKEKLTARFPVASLFTISVPGNHDLELPEGSDEYRKQVVDGSLDSLLQPDKNQFYLKKLLEPQDNYHNFSNAFDFYPNDLNTRICGSFRIDIDGHTVRFNLLNSALLSQKSESQGSLLLPLPLVERELDPALPELTISVMHHPTFWIESNNLTQLRDLFARTTDYLITGHQHVSSVFDVKTELGDNIRYYESPALFDPLRSRSSGFRVLVLDLKQRRERQSLFTWESSLYTTRRTSEFEWKDISAARQIRQSLTMNATAMTFLTNPGFAAPSGDGRMVTLQELFVYPDLKVSESILSSKQAQMKKGPLLIGFLTEGGIKEVRGTPLSGKTTLSRALALDIRTRGIATTLWLDGKALASNTLDEFESSITRAFRQFYSADQLDAYFQLPPDQRCIIIDDWHLANIRTPIRIKIYEWLASFTKSSVLMVDETYQIQELLATPQGASILGIPTAATAVSAEIVRLSRVGLANLIHKYLRITTKSTDLLEETNELLKLETLVSELLGKDWLPVFPFFALGILQAVETKRTTAIAGGSHGPLYEAIIYSALLKQNRDDEQVARKIVFLQEIAYRMWSTKMTTLSPQEIQAVVDAFYESSYLRLPSDRFLEELSRVRILAQYSGNFTFSYPQYFYYFVALYISAHIDDPDKPFLGANVDAMIDNISSVENSAIVMLLIYLDRDKNYMIDRLVRNAKAIYGSVIPAKMEDDAANFSSLRSVQLKFDLEKPPDVVENRHQVRLLEDAKEESRLLEPKSEMELNKFAAYAYSEDLPEDRKLHLVSQSIKALGQVIRNLSADLTGPRKVEVIKETYLLALRAIARVMDVMKDARANIEQYKPPANVDMSELEFRRMLDDLFTLLAQIFAVIMCQSVSDNVGIADMDKAYTETADQLGMSIAIRLIDLTVQLNHFAGVPEALIRDLHDELRANAFSSQVLDMIVIAYLMLHKVDPETFKRIRKALVLRPHDHVSCVA